MKTSKYERGLTGETIAETYLTEQGMHCLAKRFRAENGEIDLIMRDGDCIVFVEVKYRPSGRAGAGLIAVTASKQRRMINAATRYLISMQGTASPVRFDVVEITADGILHVPNAFQIRQ